MIARGLAIAFCLSAYVLAVHFLRARDPAGHGVRPHPSAITAHEVTAGPRGNDAWQADILDLLRARISAVHGAAGRFVISFAIGADGAVQNLQVAAPVQSAAGSASARDLIETISRTPFPPPPDHQRHAVTLPVSFVGVRN